MHVDGFRRAAELAGKTGHAVVVVGDAGPDLLAAAVGVGQEAVDVQSGGVGHHVAGGVGGVDVVVERIPA